MIPNFLYAPLGYMSRQWNSVSTISYFLSIRRYVSIDIYPDSKVHRANMGPTWILSAPDGPHVGPMNLATRVSSIRKMSSYHLSILVLRDPALCNAWIRRPLLPKEMFRTIHSRVFAKQKIHHADVSLDVPLSDFFHRLREWLKHKFIFDRVG